MRPARVENGAIREVREYMDPRYADRVAFATTA
jgi:hypothetical protein